jgi:hypothetical protein
MLVVRLTARDQLLGLEFWSKHRGAFDKAQVVIARRIADHVALAVSHEQLAAMSRQAAEAKLLADRLEVRSNRCPTSSSQRRAAWWGRRQNGRLCSRRRRRSR